MKEYIAKNKVSLISHVIALGVLLVGFILGRYVFFDVHGMKEFPTTLLILGLVVMVISAITSKKVLPYFISAGYIIGFVFGFLFQVTKMDANGVSVNNLWVIWAGVYVAFIVAGFLFELCSKKYGSFVQWKKSRAKRILITILAVMVVWLCVGITDFALVHNYRKPFFCIGVDLADDGGSGNYVGMGYSFDIEGNFMPEEITGGEGSGTIGGIPAGSYEVFVRNSESNNNYKDTATETLNVTGALNFVAGQKLQEGMSYFSHAYPLNVTEPPELVVVCGEERITALKGTYSWMYNNGDGTTTGVESESAHPLECKELMPDLPLAYSTKSSIDVFKAHLQFAIEPDEIVVRYWSTDCWNKPSEKSYELEVQALEVDFVDGSVATDYIVKLLEKNNIYEVIAKWNSSEEYSGTAYYSFYTVMGDYESVSVGK